MLTKHLILAMMVCLCFGCLPKAQRSETKKALATSNLNIAAEDSQPAIAPGTVRTSNYPLPKVIFSNGAVGIPDLTYATPSGFRPLMLDLYLPPESLMKPARGFPLIVYIHGGGWMVGDRRRNGTFIDFPDVLASLAAKGYVVAAVSYRLSGEAAFPAQIQDIKLAIRWLRQNAVKYAIDPTRAMTWGVSAGGHLAALASVSCNIKELGPANEKAVSSIIPDALDNTSAQTEALDCIQGAVAWYGVFDLNTLASQREDLHLPNINEQHAELLLRCTGASCKSGFDLASPNTYVDASKPPMLLIAGDEDKVVPYLQSVNFAQHLKEAGVQHELIIIPGVDHVFIGHNPEQTKTETLKALKATFQFFDANLGVPVSK